MLIGQIIQANHTRFTHHLTGEGKIRRLVTEEPRVQGQREYRAAGYATLALRVQIYHPDLYYVLRIKYYVYGYEK